MTTVDLISRLNPFCSTGRMGWMAHRKWEEAKQLPGTAGPGNMLGCCLIYFHFLGAIHPIRPVHWCSFVDWKNGHTKQFSYYPLSYYLKLTVGGVLCQWKIIPDRSPQDASGCGLWRGRHDPHLRLPLPRALRRQRLHRGPPQGRPLLHETLHGRRLLPLPPRHDHVQVRKY